ncbi:MAG: hypothetical protein DRN04_15360 [Thermoprotei archaeon]|nr:MAG: hypothetical protein DRN04_15360 [Thermoprotei archaeon]
MELIELDKPKGLEMAFSDLTTFNPKLALFFISRSRRTIDKIVEIVRRVGLSDVKGYWVNPLKARKLIDKVIKEINF